MPSQAIDWEALERARATIAPPMPEQWQQEAADALVNFALRNKRFWQLMAQFPEKSSPVKSNNGSILVDLCHDNVGYLHNGLHTAKCLQRLNGQKLVGLASRYTSFQWMQPNWEEGVFHTLCDTYQLHGFAYLDTRLPSEHWPAYKESTVEQWFEQLFATLQKAGTAWPETLAAYRLPSGVHLGAFLYESMLRTYLIPTLSGTQLIEWKSALKTLAIEAYLLSEHYCYLIRQWNVKTLVAGHFSYITQGLLMDVAIHEGVEVFNFHVQMNYMYRFNKELLGDALPGFAIRLVNNVSLKQGLQSGKRVAEGVISRDYSIASEGPFQLPNYWLMEPLQKPSNPNALRKKVCQRLGFDPAKPVVTVTSHAFSDAVCNDEQVYLDYFTWFKETLAIAKRHPERNWLFKEHPHNWVYDHTGAGETLKQEAAAYSHICFINNELTKTELFTLTDLGTTIRGSLGYDFVAAGIPVILAGKGHYSDWDFAPVAQDAAHYEALLTGALPVVSPEAKERAQLYLLFNARYGACRSALYPPQGSISSVPSTYWRQATELLSNVGLDDDPFYQSLKQMLWKKQPRLLNEPLLQQLETLGVGERKSVREVTQPLPWQPKRSWWDRFRRACKRQFGYYKNKALN